MKAAESQQQRPQHMPLHKAPRPTTQTLVHAHHFVRRRACCAFHGIPLTAAADGFSGLQVRFGASASDDLHEASDKVASSTCRVRALVLLPLLTNLPQDSYHLRDANPSHALLALQLARLGYVGALDVARGGVG